MQQLSPKTYQLDVSCVSDGASDCSSLEFDVTPVLAQLVKDMQKAVIENQAYCMKTFYSYLDWFDVDKNNYRIDCPMLVVTSGVFYFESYPKHCGDDLMLRSEAMDIRVLEN